MNGRLQLILNRLEALSLRERVMLLAGTPLLLALAAEGLAFGPLRSRTDAAQKEAVLKQGEVKALTQTLAAKPAVVPLPTADLLRKQRDELRGELDAAEAARGQMHRSTDWGSVVRASASGGAGAPALIQLRTSAPEVVFSPTRLSAAAAPIPAGRAGTPASAPVLASATAAASAPDAAALEAARAQTVYRHRAELNLKGQLGALLNYIQALQRPPGDLHWDKLQLSVTAYPQATAQLTVYTLSDRPETPFNPR